MSILGCLLAGSAFVSIFGQTGTRRREALGLLTAAIFPPVAVALCSVIWTPVFAEKMFLTSATMCPIFFLLPLGMPLPRAGLRMAWCGTAILLLLTGLTLFGYYREITKEDWRGIARIVSELPGDRRLIVFIANDGRLPFDYYYHYRPEDEATGVPSDFFDLDPPRTMRRSAWQTRSRTAAGSPGERKIRSDRAGSGPRRLGRSRSPDARIIARELAAKPGKVKSEIWRLSGIAGRRRDPRIHFCGLSGDIISRTVATIAG